MTHPAGSTAVDLRTATSVRGAGFRHVGPPCAFAAVTAPEQSGNHHEGSA